MRLVWATVTEVEGDEPELQKLRVAVDGQASGRAVAYPQLSGRCERDDRVLLNTTAVDLDLGTGGIHFVVAREGDRSGVALEEASGGHIMKLRYTPMQLDVASVEEQGGSHHEIMAAETSLEGTPVVCCGLHSQVPLVAAAVKHRSPDARVVYVMTDSGSLPLALSDVVRQSRGAGLLDATITTGHAFGGDVEAVNLYSGLIAARHVCRADVAIVAIGPGVVGTATPLGHGGVAQAESINATAVLEGIPIAVVRASLADERPRHNGVSHHTLTALTTIALASAVVALPDSETDEWRQLFTQLDEAGVWDRHRRAVADGDTLPAMRGIEVRTMGRGPSDDPAFFACAFAAGDVAARLAHEGFDLGVERPL